MRNIYLIVLHSADEIVKGKNQHFGSSGQRGVLEFNQTEHTHINMSDARADTIYMAKVQEQTERYDGIYFLFEK